MLDRLLTEQTNPASEHIDTLPASEILRVMYLEDRKAAEAVAVAIPEIARAVDGIVAAMERGGRLFYIGAGTSGRLGVLDASEIPPTFGVPAELVQGIIAGGEPALTRSSEGAEDDALLGAQDLLRHGFSGGDVLVGIAASGRTPYVLGAISEANRMGALTIGISCTPESELSARVKIPIGVLTGPVDGRKCNLLAVSVHGAALTGGTLAPGAGCGGRSGGGGVGLLGGGWTMQPCKRSGDPACATLLCLPLVVTGFALMSAGCGDNPTEQVDAAGIAR